MPRLFLSIALGALLALPVVPAMALGFGRVSNATVLGQTLNFAVAVRLDTDESLIAECVSVEVYSGEGRLPSTALRVSIEAGGEPAERILRVSSSLLIDEPVINVNVQVTCPNRLSRRFVAFIDPPVVNLAQVVAPAPAMPLAPEPTPPPPTRSRADAKPVSGASTGNSAPASKAPGRAAPRPRRAASPMAAGGAGAASTTVASDPSASAARSRSAANKSAHPPVRVARLKLEAIDDDATRERLSLRLTGAIATLPSTAASGAGVALPAVEDAAAEQSRARMLAMEQALQRLATESKANQASLVELQSRLRDAEGQRYANPLVFALAALVAALALAVGVLWWRRAGERRADAQWWDPRASASPEASHGLADEHVDAHAEWGLPPREAQGALRRLPADEPEMAETTGSPMLLGQAQAYEQTPAVAPPQAAELDHEMSVEELIDLEQQAEFFVVLGQDEAAIDLLMGHLRSSGGASPLPYLKLLEIFRARDDHEAYERMRERFNRRFNAYAHDWQSDPKQGRSLLDYPNAMARLQVLWSAPAQAMQALEASLFRRDVGSSTFDLPAYRELLLLYSVARDLSEREASPAGVDLLLPIGGEEPAAPALTRLHPTPPQARVAAESAPEVDVDITSLDPGSSVNDDRPSRFHTDFGPTSGYAGLPGEAQDRPPR